jgi:uncharacterized cupin superfamily protein
MQEAKLRPTESGLSPEGPGWFVVNARDAVWDTSPVFGSACVFEGEERFSQLGINLTVVEPGQPSTMYHEESNQEDFLVLYGECLLLIEEEERPLKPWDFVHCPPGALHGFVGAGEGPCVILSVGTRDPNERVVYPVSQLAQRHGAGVERETTQAREAYAGFPEPRLERPPHWEKLPWASE